MAIIVNGSMKIGGKKVRLKIFGREDKKGDFIKEEVYISNTDLINIGVLEE